MGFSHPFSKSFWTVGVSISVYKQLLTLSRLHYFEPGGREFESLRARHINQATRSLESFDDVQFEQINE